MKSVRANRLAKESSPYLLQHAYNPVDWYPWGEEAFSMAETRDLPILVSIGYAACHWCHVMEKESFEDPSTAEYMNRHFINIKIDREERPDLDQIYMDAVQAISGNGGWPLNVFLTPDRRPFFGGTYFPPEPVPNRPSWKNVLKGVAQAYREKNDEILAQAESLTAYIRQSGDFGTQSPGEEPVDPGSLFTLETVREIYANIMKSADKEWGGFSRAPKFPQVFVIRYLLHYYWHRKDEPALQQACLSLDKMIRGGIYDQLGGGFARYSTDTEWLVPHFEKMLYDNALLIMVLCEAYQLTGREHYLRTIRETVSFVDNELRQEEGGFYSSLDADSEGEEGKFYVWDKKEIDDALGDDSPLFCEYYDVTERGNWEHRNILNLRREPAATAAAFGISEEELQAKIDQCRSRLLATRNKRVRPGLDDKSILSWNALMVIALCRAAGVTGDNALKQSALRGLHFMLEKFSGDEGAFFHNWKKDRARNPAFLDDYALLIQALLAAQELTAEAGYLDQARTLLEYVLEHFTESGTGFFYYTHTNQEDVIVRKKEIYDGATPSGNAVMAMNLYYLGIVFDRRDWIQRAFRTSAALLPAVVRYPTSFAVWAVFIQGLCFGIPEIALVGEDLQPLQSDFLRIFTPLRIFQAGPSASPTFPLLSGKANLPGARLYLCKNYSCQNPVTEINGLIRQLETV